MCVCVCVQVTSPLFILSVDEHLIYFHIFALINNAALNIGLLYLFELVSPFSSDVDPGVELLSHMAVLFSVF